MFLTASFNAYSLFVILRVQFHFSSLFCFDGAKFDMNYFDVGVFICHRI